MDLFEILDLACYGLMLLDLAFRYVRVRSTIKKLGKTKRYRKSANKIKLVLYVLFTIINVGYLGYRLFQVQQGNYAFFKGMILLPIILYYILNDILLGGIYYSQMGIYIKSNLILFGEITKAYRHYFENGDFYHYTVYYQPKLSGEIEFEFDIPNEPNAFELMIRIPFTNND